MMPAPNQPHPPPITPAKATANRALGLTFYRTTGNSQQRAEALRIGAMMCWDAVMDVAQAAGGIQTRVNVQGFQYNRMFPQGSPVVANAQAAIVLPVGCFVGFITPPPAQQLVHVMIHVGVGWAAGTNNGSMFPAAQLGGIWQLINLTSFFGSAPHTQRGIQMIYRTVNGMGL